MPQSPRALLAPLMNADSTAPSPIETAIALANAGRFEEAETLAKQRLAGHPHDSDALNLLGGLARARGDHAAAVQHYSEALRENPHHPKAQANLGAALLETGRIEDALRQLRAVVARDPAAADARVNLGAALIESGDYAAAEVELRAVLATTPDDALALNSLANVLFHTGRIDAAITACEDAIRHDPTLAIAFNNLGSAWREKGDIAKAEQAFRRAVALRPQLAGAWTGLGVVLRGQGRFAEARAAHDRALAVNPTFAPARFNRSVIDLGEGRFGDGFRDYRARPLDVPEGVERDALPADLSGRRVMLLPNQGLGDELFFLRFAPALKRRGATLIYRAAKAIAAMVARSAAIDVVVTGSDADPMHDLAVSIGDLPFLLGVETADDLPPPLPLPTLADQLATIKKRLAQLGPPPYVGITWRAGTREWNALLKEIPGAALGAALSDIPATVLALQRAPDAREIDIISTAMGGSVHDLSELNGSLETMLALLQTIDVYVGVSNTNTHLRAGTGRPSHVLVPHPPEWRWMHVGDRSPWFPNFPLYRETPTGDSSGWNEALAALRRDILAFLAKG